MVERRRDLVWVAEPIPASEPKLDAEYRPELALDAEHRPELEPDAEQFEAVSDALHHRLGALTRGEAADRELLAHSSRAQHKRKRDVAASAAAAQPLPVGSVAARRAEEASRRLSIAMYREGLREVLTDAIASLEEMTGA